VVPRAQIQARLLLADAALHRGDAGAATRELRAATAVLSEEPDAVVLHDWADELDRRLDRLRGRPGEVGLTAAELRVLEQLPTHRSLVEIGDHLYVSRNTVKTHTLSIYRKLYVSGRSEAVERARELGLLDGDPVAPR
jgi:LuxR family transcriptional regulator, maltose regulon positive regulatory protein